MFESIDVKALHALWSAAKDGKECTIIDVRTPEEYAAGHVPSAKLTALNTVPARADEFPKQGRVYLICKSGLRSAQAADYLTQQCGHDNLVNVTGGTMAWASAGYPVDR
jgi:rhodanese-related sulfurtransferase